MVLPPPLCSWSAYPLLLLFLFWDRIICSFYFWSKLVSGSLCLLYFLVLNHSPWLQQICSISHIRSPRGPWTPTGDRVGSLRPTPGSALGKLPSTISLCVFVLPIWNPVSFSLWVLPPHSSPPCAQSSHRTHEFTMIVLNTRPVGFTVA